MCGRGTSTRQRGGGCALAGSGFFQMADGQCGAVGNYFLLRCALSLKNKEMW